MPKPYAQTLTLNPVPKRSQKKKRHWEWRELCGGETYARILALEFVGSSSFNLYPVTRTVTCAAVMGHNASNATGLYI